MNFGSAGSQKRISTSSQLIECLNKSPSTATTSNRSVRFSQLACLKLSALIFQVFIKIVIRNLIFNYNESSGDLIFIKRAKNLESHRSVVSSRQRTNVDSSPMYEHWSKSGVLKDMKVAQVSYVNPLQGIQKALKTRFFIMPCNLDWSSANSRRIAVTRSHGKCLRFVAASLGDIFVVFATNPQNEYTWYFVQISSYGVAIYKAGMVVDYRLEAQSGSLKDGKLFRRFFVCFNYERLAESDSSLKTFKDYKHNRIVKNSTEDHRSFKKYSGSSNNEYRSDDERYGLFIQYGIVQDYESKGTVHLSYLDRNPLELRYYMFGSYDHLVNIYDINLEELSPDDEAEYRCSTHELQEAHKSRCDEICHKNCIG